MQGKCIKLYCECFANGIFCSPACNCKNCLNTKERTADTQKLNKSEANEVVGVTRSTRSRGARPPKRAAPARSPLAWRSTASVTRRSSPALPFASASLAKTPVGRPVTQDNKPSVESKLNIFGNLRPGSVPPNSDAVALKGMFFLEKPPKQSKKCAQCFSFMPFHRAFVIKRGIL